MCLSSLVGVRGCASSPETPQFYINDVPGVSIANAADIAEHKGEDLLNTAISNASNQLISDLSRNLLGVFSINSIVDTWTIGRWYKDYRASTIKSGFRLEQYCENCRLANWYINAVEFQAKEDFDGKVVLKIGNVEHEYLIESLAGNKAYVAINKEVNATAFEIWVESADSFQLVNTSNCCYSEYLSLQLIGEGNIIVTGQMRCNTKRLICEYKDLFGFALQQLAGVYFYNEAIVTNRVNYFTVYNSDEKAEMQKHILNSKYEKEMKNIVRQLIGTLRQQGGCCVSCEGNRWTHQIP